MTLSSTTCKSVFKGHEFKVHNAHVEGLEMNENDYLHSLDEKGADEKESKKA